MNDVPLVNKNDINSINTSLIAIKKQLKQLNEAVGLIDVPDVDLTPFVRKDEVVDVIESGNMNPVTSNAVSQSLSYSTEEVNTGAVWIDGKPIYRKVFVCSTTMNLSVNSWNDVTSKFTGLSNMTSYISDIEDARIKSSNIMIDALWIRLDSNKIYLLPVGTTFQIGANLTYLILEYTKTTDTATRSIPTETRSIEEPIEEPTEEEKK